MHLLYHILSLVSAVSAANMAIARFEAASSSGATGYVKVYGGIVEVSLNLTNFNFSANTTGGLSYHIHARYNNLNTMSSFGSSCGATNTGGHYDPWFACAGPSDQPLCKQKMCITQPPVYQCSPTLFMSNPLRACEVGDWSGKYGKVMPMAANSMIFKSNSTTAVNPPSRYEVSASYLVRTNRSVVIHDATGKRILCAQFVTGASTPNDRAPVEGILEASYNGKTAFANFTSIGGPTVQIGGGQIKIDPSKALNIAGFIGGCTGSMFTAYVSQKDRLSTTVATMGSACGSRSANGIRDPTFSCILNSGSTQQCTSNGTMSVRCKNFNDSKTFDYTTVSMESLYNVAQGSFSINLTSVNAITMPLIDESTFTGKVLVLECASNTTIQRCAPIEQPAAVSRPKSTTSSPTNATTDIINNNKNPTLITSPPMTNPTKSAGNVAVLSLVIKIFLVVAAMI